jgi:hypothetical protein
MGTVSRRIIHLRRAGAISGARKRRRLGDVKSLDNTESESHQIESQPEAEDASGAIEVLEEVPGKEKDEEGGGERENGYSQDLKASDSGPPNSEGSVVR